MHKQDRSIEEIIDTVRANQDRINRRHTEVNGLGSSLDRNGKPLPSSPSPARVPTSVDRNNPNSPSPKAILESLRAQIEKSKQNKLKLSKPS